MSQTRLNHAKVLHIHNNLTDNLSLIDIGNEFVRDSVHRQSVFGNFLQTDYISLLSGVHMQCHI